MYISIICFELLITIAITIDIIYKIQVNFYEYETLEWQERVIYRMKSCSLDAV